MSSSDFRGIAIRKGPGKADRLFRAAVTAFCSLTRPSRREVSQLEDLARPLYDEVSVETLRYAAAALSECRRAPGALIRRLATEPIEIAVPLLLRSSALADVDLIGIIGQSGLAHARAIGRRHDLNPRISALIRMLETAAAAEGQSPAVPVEQPPKEAPMLQSRSQQDNAPGARAEATRGRLRTMMAAGGEPSASPVTRQAIRASAGSVFDRLRSTALSGTPALFQTALADALDIGFAQARDLTRKSALPSLSLALRGLDLSPEQAFMLAAAVCPTAFAHAESIRLFVDRYTLTHAEAGRDEIRRLRGETLSAMVRPTWTQPPATAEVAPQRHLKAS